MPAFVAAASTADVFVGVADELRGLFGIVVEPEAFVPQKDVLGAVGAAEVDEAAGAGLEAFVPQNVLFVPTEPDVVDLVGAACVLRPLEPHEFERPTEPEPLDLNEPLDRTLEELEREKPPELPTFEIASIGKAIIRAKAKIANMLRDFMLSSPFCC